MTRRGSRLLGSVACLVLLMSCSKKAPKPLHSEPWLAHPPPSAGMATDAAVASVPFHLAGGSSLSFELHAKQARWHGELKSLSGELTLDPSSLQNTRARFSADLRSLALAGEDNGAGNATARALRALELAPDAGAEGFASASFELSGLSELSSASAAPRVRATALGQLTLHGFRVSERVPIEAELTLDAAGGPTALVIRSRAPLVVTLATHQIAAPSGETFPREARVSFEFHLEK